MMYENPSLHAGLVLKQLIKNNYTSQEEFAYDAGYEIRTVSRYVNNGINKLNVIQEIAEFFGMDFYSFMLTKVEGEE